MFAPIYHLPLFLKLEIYLMQTNDELYLHTKTWVEQLFLNKKDKAERPYVEHLKFVHQKVAHFFDNNPSHPAAIAALLHDTLEDTNTNLDELKNKGFSDEIIGMVVALTKPEHLSYQDYIETIGNQSNEIIIIKLYDLYHNMDILRLINHPSSNKDFKRLEKYQQAYLYLSKILANKYSLIKK